MLKYLLPIAVLLSQSVPAMAQSNDARGALMTYLAGIGASQLAHRAEAMAAVRTRADAERRQAEVRRKILDAIGGLPEWHGPVRVQQFGTIEEDGFRVEKIAYESLPDFWVTADVYVPAAGQSPFPAVILTPGHGPGKESQTTWGANLARSGVIALAVDTMGASERLQHYDPELETSKVEPSGEHEHAGLSTLLIGRHVSRYFINDGMRGVDYLIGRKDVARDRIGAFGCSGGGTVTAYLGALDPRIAVTASACYITSFQELLNSRGAQDAEQTPPNFVADGLDFADWVELCAPRAYAVISTTNDMFPFAGATATVEEAKRFYGLFDAQDRLQWITGPGGHGNLGPITPQIMAFLLSNLGVREKAAPFRPFVPAHPDDLQVTPTGQVSASLGGETVESLNRKEAAGLLPAAKVAGSAEELTALQARVRSAVRAVAAVTAAAGAAPAVTVTATEQKEGYRSERLSMRSEPGMELEGLALIPDRSGPKPAVLLLQEMPRDRQAALPDVQRLVKSGHLVLILQSRGISFDGPAGPPQPQTSILGPNTALALQAMAVGKSLIGMRVDDVIRAVNWLATLPDVDRSAITLYGRAAEGIVALHAAALDERISRVVVENTLVSYRMALEAPLHRNLSDIVLPGVLLRYDVGELLEAIAPRPVVLVNAADAMGLPAHEAAVRKELAAAFQSDARRGEAERIHLVHRGFRDPLPIE